jgi:6-phosphogluconolactonase (cycloisomerase 2 family)
LLIGNQRSNVVTVFEIDATSGRLSASGHTLSVGSPVDIQFAPAQVGAPRL